MLKYVLLTLNFSREVRGVIMVQVLLMHKSHFSYLVNNYGYVIGRPAFNVLSRIDIIPGIGWIRLQVFLYLTIINLLRQKMDLVQNRIQTIGWYLPRWEARTRVALVNPPVTSITAPGQIRVTSHHGVGAAQGLSTPIQWRRKRGEPGGQCPLTCWDGGPTYHSPPPTFLWK